jgi:hypothetical protein
MSACRRDPGQETYPASVSMERKGGPESWLGLARTNAGRVEIPNAPPYRHQEPRMDITTLLIIVVLLLLLGGGGWYGRGRWYGR